MSRQTLKVCVVVLLFGLLPLWATPISAEPLDLEETENAYSLRSHLFYLLAPGHKTVRDITQNPQDFKRHTGQSVLNLGYSTKALWLNFTVNNESLSDRWILEYGYYPPKTFELYQKKTDGTYQRLDSPGNKWPSRYLAYKLPLTQGLNEFYLKIHTNASLTVPLTLSTPRHFSQNKQVFYFAQALYFGWVASLILYNLFLFLSFRDQRFGYYILFASSLALALAFYYGFPQQMLEMEYSDTTTIIGTVLFNLASLFAISFARRFLSTKLHAPIGDRVLLFISIIFWASIVTVVIWPESTTSSWLLSLGAPAGAVIAMIIAILCLIRGYKQARFFLIAWSACIFRPIMNTYSGRT